jgi:cytosine/adenosine deaminase-related metal-dependent hydrolase
MTILRAKLVVPMSQPPIENGAVAVEGDMITAVGTADEVTGGEVRDLGEVVLAPGLINTHCHLDYTGMINQVEWRGSFIEWILLLVALKQLYAEKDYLTGIAAGLDQLAKSGTTSVVNIESFPTLIDQLPESPLRVAWCLELMDFQKPDAAEQLVQAVVAWVDAHPTRLGGISPHAPFTASAELYRLAARYARGRQLTFTTHLAESEEEDDMFRRGIGPMYDYFRRAGRDMTDCKRVGPVQLLHEMEVLTPNCLLVHANSLTRADVQLLATTGAHVVHCPKAHRFFHRATPLLENLMHAGINVCLGTDSLASNDTLNMFAEMQELARVFPRWSAEQILTLATANAAKALNQKDKLGMIAFGATADLIAVPLDGPVIDPYEAVVFAEKPVTFSMIGGKTMLG